MKKKQLKGIINMDDVGEDRISRLPDHLRLHILSFLPTKWVFSTSVLSKRWRYLWTSIPILDFREWHRLNLSHHTKIDYPSETQRFMNFVDQVLFLHEMPKIQKFYIRLDSYFDKFRVNAWLTTLIRHKVEELILLMECGHRIHDFKFPLCLFTCESLTLLELDMVDIDGVLNLPQSISFPRLKILRLSNCIFLDENLTQLLFSSCPVLEELSLISCSWVDFDLICISAPALKRFILNVYDCEPINYSKVKIYAPNLLCLTYNEGVAKEFVLHGFPSLENADIDYIHDGSREQTEVGYHSTKLLERLSNVKLLKMSGNTFEVLSYAVGLLTNLPEFCNLIHLEVSSIFAFSTVRTLFNFLQVTPNLESLVFAQGSYDYEDGDGWTLNLVPQCLVLQLKSVEFLKFNGCPKELNLVKQILMNAGVLQKMTMTIYLPTKEETEIMRQLLMFPRASTNCVVCVEGKSPTH